MSANEMSTNEMSSKVQELRELRRMAEKLAGEMEAVQDTIKVELTVKGTEEAQGTDWKITWRKIASERIDSKSLRAELPEVAARYIKQASARRFVLA